MMGTGRFALPTFLGLYETPHEVVGLFTQPDRAGRGHHRHPHPMKEAALEHGTPVFQPDKVNTPAALADLRSLEPELCVVAAYGQILSAELLSIPARGAINVHASLLPKYRGAAPVQWAILNGDVETGNSVIHMTPQLDAGPCLAQQRTPIDPNEDAEQLEARLAQMGADLVCQVVDQLASGTARPIEQEAQLASKAPRLKKEDGAIDWSRSAQEIKNQVRALRPWPSAFTFWHRAEGPPLRLVIDRVAVAASQTSVVDDTPSTTAPGTVIAADERLVVATGEGALEVLELQPAGKRSMSAGEFLRGNRIRVGDEFGPE
jgi:methionyl-tRNA formyltransferase